MTESELREYLAIVEQKLLSLMQDIRNIRDRLEPQTPQRRPEAPNFFDALSGEDNHADIHYHP